MKRIKIDLKIGMESLDMMARDTVTTHYLGNYKSIFRGRGLEFDSYRQYTPEDSADMIDWKATARSGNYMVRQYIEERNLDVFFLVDVSNTMILSSQPKLKCEYSAELVSSLSLSILKAGDNVGYALFNNKIVDFHPPKKGMHIYSELVDTLSQAKNYGGEYSLKPSLDFVTEYLNTGTLVIIISDFIGLSSDWEEAVKLAASKFSLIGIMILDPIDRKIPEGMGQIGIANPYSNERLIIDPNIIKPYYEEEAKRMEEEIRSAFLNNNGDFVILQTDSDFIGKMIELFKMRQSRYR